MMTKKARIIFWILSILFIVAIVGDGYLGYTLRNYIKFERPDFLNKISSLESLLQNERDINRDLNDAYIAEKQRNDDFADQIGDITDTVGDLEKLNALDPELLIKYSKIYFLNENYIPSKLTEIDEGYRYNGEKEMEIHAEVWPYLQDLLDDAKDDGMNLKIISAYRSFGTQAALKSSYKVIYGAGTANQFSADQGYSEHQLGTTVDFTNSAVGSNFVGFDKTPEYEWLLKNAYRYGFVLSYPQNNSYYQFEPWHWRFVGRKLARSLDRGEQYFYDLDQREIDKYLLYIFD